jgi:hypothetical protein
MDDDWHEIWLEATWEWERQIRLKMSIMEDSDERLKKYFLDYKIQ